MKYLTVTPTPAHECPACGSHDTALTSKMLYGLVINKEPAGIPTVTMTQSVRVDLRCMACGATENLPDVSKLVTKGIRPRFDQIDRLPETPAGHDRAVVLMDLATAELAAQIELVGEMVA